MHRYKGLRVCVTNAQARHMDRIRASQRFVYNWAVERLLADSTLTRFDLQKLFTKLRNSTPHLREVERIHQDTAVHQARAAADVSNKYVNGNLKFRSKKRGGRLSVTCDIPPRFVNSAHASFPGLGTIRLYDEQSYQYPHHWLHGSRSFMLVDKTGLVQKSATI